MRRLHQTLADYVVIAISPALIMALVGSLVYFLLALFYQGQYQFRLHWVMACFVFGAVLIERISIEEGFERAVLFGAPLAILVAIAAGRFMVYDGTWIDDFGWIINCTLIAIVWWCVHKLTWDCTVIDDSQDASGEGLMQVAGLERPADRRNAAVDEQRKLEGTTSRAVPAGFWQRYVEHQRRPHAPGVWVVYFSLAALPIFGVGGWFVSPLDSAARRYVFVLLCIYVASGLGLLVTTSFLGLRRYLRQRRIEMPTTMANVWLGIGVAVILALLVVAALVPRPGAEYAISQLPFTVGAPAGQASKRAPAQREGTRQDEPEPGADPANRESGDQQQADQPEPTGAGNEPQGEAQDESASATSSNAKSQAEGKAGKAQSGETKASDAQGKSSEKSAQGDRAGQQDEKPSEAENNSKAAQPLKGPEEERGQAAASKQEPSDDSDPGESETAESTERSISTPSIADAPVGPLAAIVKWISYGVFALVVLWAMWRYRAELLAAVRSFLQELRGFWDSLWGRRREVGAATAEIPQVRVPVSPFSAYSDPFAGGQADRYSIEELVRYSFEAFEAWSREHGCPRDPEQTPHELARDVARLNSFIATEARQIAELYARAAYSKGALPADSRGALRQLWQKMSSDARLRAISADELQSWT